MNEPQNEKPIVTALITAAGKGTRMGAGKNKLLLKISGKTVLEYTLEKFVFCSLIDNIVIAAAAEDIPEIKDICGKYKKDITITEGADTRTQSVFNGLKAVSPFCGIVLIHDGARPFVSENIIKCCIDDVKHYGSAVAAVPVTDTIKKADSQFMITSTLDRSELYSIQTPQGFIYKDILSAYLKIKEGENYTDDSSVYERHFGNPYISMGEPSNIKITYYHDLKAFSREGHFMVRCGSGYDSHRLAAGRKLILGGTEIPYEKGLLGHSDADALIHAVIDSLLSAAGLGDIGTHFPDTSEEYKDIDSIKLLKKTKEMIIEKGFAVSNISCIIICQKPKLALFIPIMRENIAATLHCDISCIGISAKTNEGMGFTGREEGIAATANCILFCGDNIR